VFDDHVRGDHFVSSNVPLPGAGGGYAARIMRLRDERFHIGHFLIEMPDQVSWSPEMFKICGLPPREGPLSLKDIVGVFDIADREKLAKLIAESLKDRKGFHATLRIRNIDDLRLVEVVGDVIETDGRLAAIVGLMRDVTHIANQYAPTNELQRMTAIVEAMPCPAVLTDTSMRILAYCDVWARSHGISGKAAIGKDLVAAVEKAPVGWGLEHDKVVSGKTVTSDRVFHSPASGRPVNCPTMLTPWVDGEGTIRGVLTVIGWSEFAFASKEIAIHARKGARGAR
jgi:hypothetical protein